MFPRYKITIIQFVNIFKIPNDWAKGIILCITVEFYAILSLLASFLMLLNLNLGVG